MTLAQLSDLAVIQALLWIIQAVALNHRIAFWRCFNEPEWTCSAVALF